jgi:hypothetical protein
MTSGEDSNHQTRWTLGAIKERNLALEGYCVSRKNEDAAGGQRTENG